MRVIRIPSPQMQAIGIVQRIGSIRTPASLFHLHRDSHEVVSVLAGEFIFMIGDAVTVGGPGTCAFMPCDVPHAWKNTGSETGCVLFLYTPTAAGSLVEAVSERRPADDDERDNFFERHRWKVVGPNPL